jgi:hypothetical protein
MKWTQFQIRVNLERLCLLAAIALTVWTLAAGGSADQGFWP